MGLSLVAVTVRIVLDKRNRESLIKPMTNFDNNTSSKKVDLCESLGSAGDLL